MSASVETIALLKSIDASLKALVRATVPPPPADLDGQYGDPLVTASDPRDWLGDPMKGRRFSECPEAYLELVASRLDYFADKAAEKGELTSSGKPREPLLRLDAARARGWAERIRKGGGNQPERAKEPAAFPSDEMMGKDDISF